MSSEPITKDVVNKIAHLAMLELTEQEAKDFSNQFNSIFEHFQKLSMVATEGIEPLITPTPHGGSIREDKVSVGLGAEKSLQNAPDKQGNLFKVPPVVG